MRRRGRKHAPRSRASRGPLRAIRWFAFAVVLAGLVGLACATCAPRTRPPSRHAAQPPAPAPTHTQTATGAATPKTPPAGSPVAASIHVALGVPTDHDPSDDLLMDKGVYVVSYNPVRKVPNWVSWRLTRASLGRTPRHDKFTADTSLPPGAPRVTPADYARSGYDRGHMCPSGDRTDSPESNAVTFLMTNMQPQLHELNDGPWKDLEEYEREVARSGKDVFIVAGGVFGSAPRTIGSAGIAVPDASYKIMAILEPGQRASDVSASTPVIAVMMPNEHGVAKRAWRDYAVAVDRVEQSTDYDFLSNVAVSVQQVIEARP